MGNNIDDEIQRNLEKFSNQQINEYKYIRAGKNKAKEEEPEPKFEELNLSVPDLNAPRKTNSKSVTGGLSYIDINNKKKTGTRSYDDDLDDDDFFDEDFEVSYQDEDKDYNDEDYYDDEDIEDEEEYEEPPRRRGSNSSSNNNRPSGKKAKKKSNPAKIIIGIIIAIIALIGIGFGLWYFLTGAAYDKMTYTEIPAKTAAAIEEEGITNILLLGNDSRSNDGKGRSDVIMLLTINKNVKKIFLTSFLRDSYLEIPGEGSDRLNHAYAAGGPELVMKTLSYNFDIKIDRYMLVNFQAFANLTDAVGGVTLDVTSEEVEYINSYLWEYNENIGLPTGYNTLDESISGELHLNGPQALAYCRNRYVGTDFARTNRQKKVLTEIIKGMPKAVLTNCGGVIEGLFPNLTTNLTKEECRKLSLLILDIKKMEIEQNSIPLDDAFENIKVNKMQVLGIDIEKNKAFIHENILAK